MSSVSIAGYGAKTELWVDGHMIGRDVVSYELTQEAGQRPLLKVVFRVDKLEVEANDVDVSAS